jgi:TPP-dependent pyruvate/acetoin dehydrogenase alpha subunit
MPGLQGKQLIDAYRTMVRIRLFEERVRDRVDANDIPGVCHEYIGQEAVAVGVCSALRDTDVITSTHRGHGHVIAKGGGTDRMMAELYGRVDGYNRGKGGSMHIADVSLGIYGANGIVGAGLPIAAGAAWVSKRKGNDIVAVPFFGDGASNQGIVHETMNMAAIFKLPMVFVCENNLYAISASFREMSSIEHVHSRAAGYGIHGEAVDGMDVEAVHEAASRLVERARRGEGPALLECKTYRLVGHFTAEQALGLSYRPKEEVAEWAKRDPLLVSKASLLRQEVATEVELEQVRTEVAAEIDAATAFAQASAWPPYEEALAHMYASADSRPMRGW